LRRLLKKKKKHLAREQKKKKGLKSKQETTPKVQNTLWGALREENMKPRPKPITSSKKQVMQSDGQKIWRNIKPRRRDLSCCHNCPHTR
jgi:hypothetical protein